MVTGFKLNTCQLALFVNGGAIRADELSFEVRKHLAIGEYDPMLIPEAPGMPPEFPRLQITTPKGFQLTMSRARVDFLLGLPLGIDDSESAGFIEKCEGLLDILRGHGYRYSRVGFIKTYFVEASKAIDVVRKVVKVPMEPVDEVTISLTKKIVLKEKKCNSLYNFVNGVNQAGEPGLFIARDLNTDPAVTHSFDAPEVKDFIASAVPLVSGESVSEFIG